MHEVLYENYEDMKIMKLWKLWGYENYIWSEGLANAIENDWKLKWEKESTVYHKGKNVREEGHYFFHGIVG